LDGMCVTSAMIGLLYQVYRFGKLVLKKKYTPVILEERVRNPVRVSGLSTPTKDMLYMILDHSIWTAKVVLGLCSHKLSQIPEEL
jgi:hypothetical protein